MQVTGASLIAGSWQIAEQAETFYGFSPKLNLPLETPVYEASSDMLEHAIAEADRAFKVYRKTSYQRRAEFLHAIADEIEALGSLLIDTTHQETNLPVARLEGERARTMGQLRAFAQALEGSQKSIANFGCTDTAVPERSPLPKPHTELDYIPLGVVGVFGASNFPYAFSTLGGDTAAALAAGCSVITKSHTAHPLTSELMARAISLAIEKCEMPKGVFSMIQAKRYDIAHQLVAAPQVKAIGFTGSFSVAQKLLETIGTRQERIPFYGELGSINPQFLFKEQVAHTSDSLASQLCQALLMGNGQFCTSPGLWLVPAASSAFIAQAAEHIKASQSDTLLSPNILSSFKQSIAELKQSDEVTLLAEGVLSEPHHANAHLFTTDIDTFLHNKALHKEVFGPMAMIVTYDKPAQLLALVESLDGQLTASVHGTSADLRKAEVLIEALEYKVGRIIENQMPTGVEVCPSMNHGGPYPSSTDVRSTSVGLNAMLRFLRPICRQKAN
ncbi:aldehyde dehydrogenase [Pseudoalteromonas citrea]|uniref:Aldehyde dehydrogenase n=1 Tax=Pseudoalteromonas citrea TaxID=43655 RepID=A0A5S3XM51_9GAMM|nr:aldehyde dehydrogenase (NADP(+)) [Pseudoalteromonas citrea]TMP41867.1 aldehyde dehydrogenase [Pseudoalteromonas citrea]TMP54328.1 aldehyde dehydrogenase [Pseudoalteromonas citrea]